MNYFFDKHLSNRGLSIFKKSSDSITPLLFYAVKVLMDLSYLMIHKIYASPDGVWYPIDVSFPKMIFSYFLLTLMILFLPRSLLSFSSFMANLQFCIMVIPILTIYGMINKSTLFVVLIALSFILQCKIITRMDPIRFKIIKNANTLVLGGLAAITGLVFIYLFFTMGLPSLTALNLYRVYEVRERVEMSKYIGYLFRFVTCIITPFFIAYSLNNRWYCCCFFWIVVQLFFYLWTGNKSMLFYIPLTIALFILSAYPNFEKILLYGLLSLLFLSFLTSFLPNGIMRVPFDMLSRRMLAVPANLKFVYFDFFKTNPQLGIGGLFPTWLIPLSDGYPKPYPFVIANLYFNSPETSTNTGYLVEGFARFGYLGFSSVFIVMGLLLKLFDGFFLGRSKRMIYPICLIAFLGFNDGFLLGSLSIAGSTTFLVLLLSFFDSSEKTNHVKEIAQWKIR